MKSLSTEEARRYCTKPERHLAVGDDGRLYYAVEKEYHFLIKHPPEYRGIVKLAYDLTATLSASDDGGMLWMYGWHLGVEETIRQAWSIVEGVRSAKGDFQDLRKAPAQVFGGADQVYLQACLIQLIGCGWPGCYVPRNGRFFIEFRSSERAFFYSGDSTLIEQLAEKFASWKPTKELPAQEYRALAISRYQAAQQLMSQADFNGAIEMFRASLLADTENYDAARGLIEALRMSGEGEEAATVQKRLVEFISK